MTTSAEKKETLVNKQRSYFATDTVHRYSLGADGSFIEHKKLDEGLFQSYQDITSRIKLDRDGESTEVDMALGRQRRFLLENLVVGWNLVDDDGQPIRYNPTKLLQLPPHIIAGLVEDIYKNNEILSGEESEEGKDNEKT
jgi:hypothetical protein